MKLGFDACSNMGGWGHLIPQGKEQICRSLSKGSAGSVFQSQEEVIGQEGAHQHPAGESEDIYRALHNISREISLEFSAGGTEESMKSEWGGGGRGCSFWRRKRRGLDFCFVGLTNNEPGMFRLCSRSVA